MSADRVTPLLLRAKRLELQAARQLAARIALLDMLRECIHALQRERCASSLYLASCGARCAGERGAAMDAGAAALDNLQALLAAQGTPALEDDRADADVEAAAQEGAAGARLFAAGQCDAAAQEHMAALAGYEAALLRQLRAECARHAQQVQQQLQDSEGLLRHLREQPPAAQPLAGETQALRALLHSQSERLARTEVELQAVRRALSERKVIERAKGVLMARLGLNEEAAFRALQKASMDQNRRLLDMAEATLALADLAFAPAQKS